LLRRTKIDQSLQPTVPGERVRELLHHRRISIAFQLSRIVSVQQYFGYPHCSFP
jgi:hypothetical protein